MGNGKQIEVGHILKKVLEPNPNSKSYPIRRGQKQKILGSEPNKGKD